ncbi:hypothetical protein ACGFXC_37135 [Streptomyces sp. NPDC048507]|uniref:hypothetical protein n=1 Tax=Streptomyces sp. NPDC048507 TaxID=3365560 RepID=UPI00371BB22E
MRRTRVPVPSTSTASSADAGCAASRKASGLAPYLEHRAGSRGAASSRSYPKGAERRTTGNRKARRDRLNWLGWLDWLRTPSGARLVGGEDAFGS